MNFDPEYPSDEAFSRELTDPEDPIPDETVVGSNRDLEDGQDVQAEGMPKDEALTEVSDEETPEPAVTAEDEEPANEDSEEAAPADETESAPSEPQEER